MKITGILLALPLILIGGCVLTPAEKAGCVARDPATFTRNVAGTPAAFAASQCWYWEKERMIVNGESAGDLQEAISKLAAIYDEVERGKAWHFAAPAVVLPALQNPPRIDGEISRGEWEGALLLTEEYPLDATRPHPSTASWRVAVSDDALCFAAEFRDANPVSESGRWGAATLMYEGDCVEFFLRPNRDSDIYFEFIVNPAGELWSLKHQVNPRGWWHKLLRDYDSGAVAAARRTTAGYSVELQIPFRIFGSLWDEKKFSFLPVRINRTPTEIEKTAPVPVLYDGHNLPCHIFAEIAK